MTEPLVIDPAEAIISATDARALVQSLASSDASDIAIEWQIRNATIAAENYIGKAIGVQTLEWRPRGMRPALSPRAP
jgi:hypothetical protein